MKKKLFALLLSLSIISLLVGGYALAENKPVVAADINSETLMVTLTSEDLMGDEEIEACGKHWLPNWEEQDGVWSTSFQMPDCDFTLYWVDQEWTLLSDLLSEHDGWVHYEEQAAPNRPQVAADINSETLMVTLTSEDLMGDEEIEACGKHWLPNWEEQDGVWSTSFQMPDCDFTLYWVDQEWTLLSDLLSEHDGWVHYEGEEIKIFLPLVVNNH